MPTYKYECKECSVQLEEIKKVDDRDVIDNELCPKKTGDEECKMKRIVTLTSSPVFKGTGFYSTDYN